ncbi:MAG TPA: hypothetical protein VFU22_00430 [Roseiflexaceae bacterium]|nr:hypothetical protein [Roseiflexaceae bacterium]
MYNVNHNMPKRWLVFNIDPDTARLGTQFMFLENPNMPMIFDIYLAAVLQAEHQPDRCGETAGRGDDRSASAYYPGRRVGGAPHSQAPNDR